MLSVNVRSPSVAALTAGARRSTTMIGSRLSILPQQGQQGAAQALSVAGKIASVLREGLAMKNV